MFQPSNELRAAAVSFVASKLNGTPEWALFPRWSRDGSRMWIESTSRSTLATISFRPEGGGEIRMSSRLNAASHGGEVFPHDWRMDEYDNVTGARVTRLADDCGHGAIDGNARCVRCGTFCG